MGETKHLRGCRLGRAHVIAAALAGGLAVGGASATEGLQGGIAILSQEAVTEVPVSAVTARVAWAASPIRVDGDLGDWEKNGIKPWSFSGDSHATWSMGRYGGKDDLAVTLRLCRDERNLYVACEIADDRLPVPERLEFSFAPADTRLIVGWRDVGQRYGKDDVHTVFFVDKDSRVRMIWGHVQQRMDRGMANNSFGTETERRVFMESQGGASAGAKIFSCATREVRDGRSVTRFEAVFPWTILTPYVPISYAPLKFNMVVHDRDGDDPKDMGIGAVGWLPGLIGVYSGAHFATLVFDPPAHREGPEAFGQILDAHFVNQNISAVLSFNNPGSVTNKVKAEVFSDPVGTNAAALVSKTVCVPPGFSQTTLAFHSEKVGWKACRFSARLTGEGGPVRELELNAPSQGGVVTIQPVSEVRAKIDALEANASTLSNLLLKIEAKGLDTAYPRAYATLQSMFVPRCRDDLNRGDSGRVLRNCDYLETVFAGHKAYMESVLKNPARQLRVPARLPPDRLEMRDGYWFAGDRPVFLWGPCFFWFMRAQAPLVGELGFNSVCPELPQDLSNKEAVEQMEMWYKMGLPVNASMHVPDLQLTGRDAAKSKLLKEYPDIANVYPNNFLPFQVQHPVARQVIEDGYRASIAFWHRFPGVRSYWLWNEPWYLNYSERTRKDFVERYLKPRYKTVEALNARWRSSYASFDEVQLTQNPDPVNTAPWYDFQKFRDELLSDFFGYLNTVCKTIDPSRPTHTKFMAASLHAFSIEKLQAHYDIAGHDGSNGDRDIPFLDFCHSLYPDKPLVDTEVHIWYGGKSIVDMVAWRLALHGLADGNWWCWTSNSGFSDSLGNAESMHALSVSGLDLQRLFFPYMYALNKKPASVATLFPDVVERRGDLKMVRLRFEIAAAQYGLGVRPFYVTEDRVAMGELSKHRLLVGGDADYVRDSTYEGVMRFVKEGGVAIVLRGSFARNEYGDPRDAGELVRPEGGEPYGEGARICPLGKGRVIVVDALDSPADVVTDGGQVLAGGPNQENTRRRAIYQRVLARALADEGLEDPVRVVSKKGSADDPHALYGLDWRCAEADGAYVLCVLAYGKSDLVDVEVAAARRIRAVTDLIRNEAVSPAKLKLEPGANLFRIELKNQ